MIRSGDLVTSRRGKAAHLGVLDFNPIQYHAPLYQSLASRGRVDFDVLYLSDHGYRSAIDPGFGVSVAWDIDLLSGYPSRFLSTAEHPRSTAARVRTLSRWILAHDAVVVHGYVDPWMLCAMGICRTRHVPYIMRGESHPLGQSTGIRRKVRDLVAGSAVAGSAGNLSIGQLNTEFYRRYGARQITFAPYSVDDSRFARAPQIGRRELLAHWGLDETRPLMVFCGKLIPRKRPLDLTAAVRLLPEKVSTLFVGDGVIADSVRASLRPGEEAVTGFVNQTELPSYYHAADIFVLPSEAEPWGLVVNEAMAAGALPVVSDRVGAAPDLVQGIGEVYPCGDVEALAAVLSRALAKAKSPGIRERVRQHVAPYSLSATAAGFEEAALSLSLSP
jgi:glycosyltransferase involved in cell wall biosynthesis